MSDKNKINFGDITAFIAGLFVNYKEKKLRLTAADVFSVEDESGEAAHTRFVGIQPRGTRGELCAVFEKRTLLKTNGDVGREFVLQEATLIKRESNLKAGGHDASVTRMALNALRADPRYTPPKEPQPTPQV